MDINIGETPAGRLKMELFSDIVPKCVTRLVDDHFSFATLGRRKTLDSFVRGSLGAL